MDTQKLLDILQHSELDRDTKLSIIDLLSRSDKKELIEDVVKVVIDWDEADEAEEASFKEALAKVAEKYDTELKKVEDRFALETKKLESELDESAKLGDIKNKIDSLYD